MQTKLVELVCHECTGGEWGECTGGEWGECAGDAKGWVCYKGQTYTHSGMGVPISHEAAAQSYG
eukprot:1158973-Pelagomonas_calceolata.AAC.10